MGFWVSILIVLEISFEVRANILVSGDAYRFQSLLSWRSVLKLTSKVYTLTSGKVSILIVLEISFEDDDSFFLKAVILFQSLLSWRSVLKFFQNVTDNSWRPGFQSLLSWRSVLKNYFHLFCNLFSIVSILIVLEISFEEDTAESRISRPSYVSILIVLEISFEGDVHGFRHWLWLRFQSLLSWRSVLKLALCARFYF